MKLQEMPASMTKDEETQLLRDLIQLTPENTYLRDALEHLQPQFEIDIRGDMPTESTLQNLRRDIAAAREELKMLQSEIIHARDSSQRHVQAVHDARNALVAMQKVSQEIRDLSYTIDNRFEKAEKSYTELQGHLRAT